MCWFLRPDAACFYFLSFLAVWHLINGMWASSLFKFLGNEESYLEEHSHAGLFRSPVPAWNYGPDWRGGRGRAPLGLLGAVAIKPACPSVQAEQRGSRMPTSESGGRSRLVGRVILSSNQVLSNSSVCRTQFGSEEECGTNFFVLCNCCEKVGFKYQKLALVIAIKLFVWGWILDLS